MADQEGIFLQVVEEKSETELGGFLRKQNDYTYDYMTDGVTYVEDEPDDTEKEEHPEEY